MGFGADEALSRADLLVENERLCAKLDEMRERAREMEAERDSLLSEARATAQELALVQETLDRARRCAAQPVLRWSKTTQVKDSLLDPEQVDSLLKEGYKARQSEHDILQKMHTLTENKKLTAR